MPDKKEIEKLLRESGGEVRFKTTRAKELLEIEVRKELEIALQRKPTDEEVQTKMGEFLEKHGVRLFGEIISGVDEEES